MDSFEASDRTTLGDLLDENFFADLAHELLVLAETPAVIMDAISWSPTHIDWWTPRPVPGCGQALGNGEACLWGHFDLTSWQATAPDHLIQDAAEIAELVAIESTLRQAGEGATTIWGVSVIEPDALRPGTRFAPLFVDTLMYCGTPLPDTIVEQVTQRLNKTSWGLIAANQPGPTPRPYTTTEWAYGVV